jgi:hypothetical protein
MEDLEWVPFDRLRKLAKVDGLMGKNDGISKKIDPEPMTVALKRLNGSQNMTYKYLNEVHM